MELQLSKKRVKYKVQKTKLSKENYKQKEELWKT